MERTVWQLYVDGASRNNPGPAGAGIYVTKGGDPVIKQGFFLGTKTNNQAEYMALLLGLCQVKPHMQPSDILTIFSDSELLIKQLQGHYAVKNPELRILHKRASLLLATVPHTLRHVLREQNQQADALANKGIDTKHPVPPELEHMCKLTGDLL